MSGWSLKWKILLFSFIASLVLFSAAAIAMNSSNSTFTPLSTTPTSTNSGGGAAILRGATQTATIGATTRTAPTSTKTINQARTVPTRTGLTPTASVTPQPTATYCGISCNPWGYSFSPGALIYSPPSTFCNYFSCIDNFWNGRGYVNECHDAMYSKSGGIQGDCSGHGGYTATLYAPTANTPGPTNTPTSTPLPTPTATASPTPTPTATPTPTPAATPTPTIIH